jgi:hypothetical protein
LGLKWQADWAQMSSNEEKDFWPMPHCGGVETVKDVEAQN